MKRGLRISLDLALPTSTVTSTTVVLGGKGMGKTNLAAVIIEEMAKAGLRWRLLDPLGVSYGLRHSKDGKGKGVECLILGGAHGDMPIEPTAGAVVADFLVEEDVDVIVDFSRKASGEMWTVGEKVRFLTELALRAFQRQGGLVAGRRRDPFCLLLDEAARYIPQVIPHGNPELAKCVGAWEQLVEEGRNIGIGVGLLTQRSARIAKSVTELADVLFAFRTVGPNSLAAITDWLGDHVPKERIRTTVEQIRSLDVGRCLVVSPGWLKYEGIVKIRERETFDSSATPKPGERQRKVSGPAAAPDLAKYAARMAETVEKAKATDPRELQKEITRLKGELAKAGKAKAPAAAAASRTPAAPDPAAVQRLVDQGVAKILNAEWGTIRRVRRMLEKSLDGLRDPSANLTAAIELLHNTPPAPSAAPSPAVSRASRASAPERPGNPTGAPASFSYQEPTRLARPQRTTDGGPIGKTPQLILNALLFLETIGVTPATRPQVAGFVGVSWDTGTFRTYLSELRQAGRITDHGTSLALTAAGRSDASSNGLPTSRDELHAIWIRKLGSTPAKMLRVLLERYPDPISRDELAAAIDPPVSWDTGTFRTYLSELRSPGLIADVGKDVRASDMLFPPGLE